MKGHSRVTRPWFGGRLPSSLFGLIVNAQVIGTLLRVHQGSSIKNDKIIGVAHVALQQSREEQVRGAFLHVPGFMRGTKRAGFKGSLAS
jgi:hypothetical protein